MKRNRRKVAGIILLILSLICIGIVVWYYFTTASKEDVYEEVKEKVVDESKKDEEQPEYVSPIDFDELHQINPDIYAWIEIPDTVISYPVVQSADDDSYYLNHTIDGQEGYPGSIYTERANTRDFTDYNTVVYGHNMKDGSMFMGLHAYEDVQYLKDHQTVNIYTPEKKYTYQVFAAVVYSDLHILAGYDFSSAEQRQLYLDSIYASRNVKSSFDESIPVDTESRILTLSTCIGGQPEQRFLVEAVLIDEE